MNSFEIKAIFEKQFNCAAKCVVASPGRINLIGEHTDYNGGYVLPAAINKYITVALAKRSDSELHLYSIDLQQSYKVADIKSAEPIAKSGLGWPDFILGVVEQLLNQHAVIGGFNLAITGNVPLGAGVSSSAAFECAVVFALNEMYELGLEKLDMVLLAQRAENIFVGVQCGVMDQFASMFGKKDHVIKLNCTTLQYEYIPFKIGALKTVLFDTKVKHSLASSAYNTRRQECEAGVAMIQKKFPGVKNLSDASINMLEESLGTEHSIIANRCRYVIEENARIYNGCKDLEKNDLVTFGKRMYQTHEGLSKLYEVSCTELDFIVGACKLYPAVIGARMMGGGFGGCVIALIEENALAHITEEMGAAYVKQFSINMGMFDVAIGNGTELISTA